MRPQFLRPFCRFVPQQEKNNGRAAPGRLFFGAGRS